MKNEILKTTFFATIILLFSCHAFQNTSKNKTALDDCPEGYTCYSELVSDKSIDLKEDTLGKPYMQLINKKGSQVIKHIIMYKSPPEIADANYSEIIYIEIDENTNKLNLKDEKLKAYKVMVLKSCFCQGAGYELITKGSMKLKTSKKGYDVSLSFASDKKLKRNELTFFVDR